jgi:seryl-tRNA synthetase
VQNIDNGRSVRVSVVPTLQYFILRIHEVLKTELYNTCKIRLVKKVRNNLLNTSVKVLQSINWKFDAECNN